jgi:hypothetical protein
MATLLVSSELQPVFGDPEPHVYFEITFGFTLKMEITEDTHTNTLW